MKYLLKEPKLARCVADITGDGHLQIQEWRHLASFFSKEMEEIEAVKKRFKELFDVEGRIYVDKSTSVKCKNSKERYMLFFISKPVSLFLKEIGTPVGNKTNKKFKVPGWIYRGKKELKAAYLRGLYDNEGSIFYSPASGENVRWRISFQMAKNEEILDSGIYFMNQLRKMLSDFGVKSSPVRTFPLNTRKDESKSISMKFDIEKTSFRNFYKYVNFEHPIKKQKLLQALS
jgi:tRNA-splicing ligase RtcB